MKSLRHHFARERRAFCVPCEREQTFRRHPLRHGMHQALTACTLGAWGIVWAALTVDWITRKPWRCRFCGHRLRPSADLSTGVPDAAPALSLPRAIPSPP